MDPTCSTELPITSVWTLWTATRMEHLPCTIFNVLNAAEEDLCTDVQDQELRICQHRKNHFQSSHANHRDTGRGKSRTTEFIYRWSLSIAVPQNQRQQSSTTNDKTSVSVITLVIGSFPRTDKFHRNHEDVFRGARGNCHRAKRTFVCLLFFF